VRDEVFRVNVRRRIVFTGDFVGNRNIPVQRISHVNVERDGMELDVKNNTFVVKQRDTFPMN